MRLPKPDTVRFQVSIKGTRFKNLKEARAEFMRWLDGEEIDHTIKVHIWERNKQRILDGEDIRDDQRGTLLRETIRRALQRGKLSIREIGRN